MRRLEPAELAALAAAEQTHNEDKETTCRKIVIS
jgi:hypothetical protein